MFVSSFKGILIRGGSSVDGDEEALICCERKGGGRTSPKTLMLVDGEMGVDVLNSKAL